MEQHDKAIAAYESAIELKKDHISAWNNLGLLYENLSMLIASTKPAVAADFILMTIPKTNMAKQKRC